MSLSRDTLLFSIVLMLWAVRIEASGYGRSQRIVIVALALALLGLVGSALSTLVGSSRDADYEAAE